MTKQLARQTGIFILLMIAIHLLGAWLFPARWTGATGLWEIVGISLLAGAIYCALMWWLRREKKRD